MLESLEPFLIGYSTRRGEHRAFLRIRMTYILGAGPDAKVAPPDYDPRSELEYLNKIVIALMDHPKALLYFNPNGEVLRNRESFVEGVEYHQKHSLPPLGLWSNVRMFNFDEQWMLMETVGMEQLDLPDLEACFPKGSFDGGAVDYFFRNCSLYLLQNGEVIKDRNTWMGRGTFGGRSACAKIRSLRRRGGFCDGFQRMLREFRASYCRARPEGKRAGKFLAV